MGKLKNLLYVFIILGVVVCATVYGPRLVAGDSGFDSGYSGGGSSGGSSSWDSGSSSGSSEPMTPGEMVVFLIFMSVFTIIVIVAVVNDRKNRLSKGTAAFDHTYEPIYLLNDNIPNFDINEFKRDRYYDFVKLQTAWMNFDYEKIRMLVTDELYNQYSMQLETLKMKNQVNVMRNFSYYDMCIKNVVVSGDELIVTAEMKVSFIDYIASGNTVLRGNSNRRIFMHYRLNYVCKINHNIDTCPHCGAKISDSASQVCEYCKCTISGVSRNWVLSKKEAISQINE